MASFHRLLLCALVLFAVFVPDIAFSAQIDQKLPPGYVRGDVVSYSYVPNRYWGRAESFGICPYLFEYGLMKWRGDDLEPYHKENIRRIDMAGKWSTAIQIYNRVGTWNDEIINLMIRCFKNRQLIVLSATHNDMKPEKDAWANLIAILDKLWANRDKELVSPEGDKATGQQLINNILAANIGDEGLAGLKTEGLAAINDRFKKEVQDRLLDGKRPFSHIKTWYNEIHYNQGVFQANADEKGRQKWPANSQFIGVDTYHYWWFQFSPFDPEDPKVTRKQVIDHANHWQDVITRYHGPDFKVTLEQKFEAKHSNDTHAMLQAIDLAGADRAMMIFIANSEYMRGCYTTPIETMDAYYDSIKAGPWVGLSWWNFDHSDDTIGGTLSYLDKTLKHYTPQHPEGLAYTDKELETYRKRFIESRMRMFNDVVYNQFGYLNGPKPKGK